MLSYERLLNPAQYKVVSSGDGPMLVVAGAGTGKTRTIVFRLAWLVEHGIPPAAILLLTFTRKAAREMLERATALLGDDFEGLFGGTFHAFAYRILRVFRPAWLGDNIFRCMDATDQQDAIRNCREESGIGKERGFPKNANIVALFSKARNKELSIRRLLESDPSNLLAYTGDLEELYRRYSEYKRGHFLMDYDDLLFELEDMLKNDEDVREQLRRRYRHILIDEYQDTNLVQARIVRLLAGDPCEGRSVMAVGDEAQSIYAFRGATVRNILDFPDLFPGTEVVPLEENYRSTQRVLDMANGVMSKAAEGYSKKLRTSRGDGDPVKIVRCPTDVDQAKCVARQIKGLLKKESPSKVAVLFRSGFQSYQLEVELAQLEIRYRKYGGIRYQEAAHVKDLLAYLNLIVKREDEPSFQRVASLHDRVGAKTAAKIFAGLDDPAASAKHRKSFPKLFEELDVIARVREDKAPVREAVYEMMTLYKEHLDVLYPEDHTIRWQGLMEILSLAGDAKHLDLFLAEMLLDCVDRKEEDEEECVTLSTIHSAKGLEWDNVIILDLVDGRFPSYRAQTAQETMEEERRLMYVACTRARDTLWLYWFDRSMNQHYGGDGYFTKSEFLHDADGAEKYSGSRDGRLAATGYSGSDRRRSMPEGMPRATTLDTLRAAAAAAPVDEEMKAGGEFIEASAVFKDIRAGRIQRCRHRVFGEGVILRAEEPNVVHVRFPGFGQKRILAPYLFVRKQ